jgi:hypothetical protein
MVMMRPLPRWTLAALLAAPLTAQLPFTPEVVDPVVSGDDKEVVDIDLDGFADGIIGGNLDGLALVWYRSGGPARTLTRHVIREATVHEEFSTDMDAADVDGDGDPDLVLADGGGSDNVLWFENPTLDPPPGLDPDPTVGANWTHHLVGTHGDWAHDVFTGDIDHDTRLDIVTGGHGRLHVFFQQAGGGWLDRDLSALAGAGGAPADVDGDLDLDLFVGGGWLEAPADPQAAAWTFWPISGSDPGDGPAVLGIDLDGDDRPDLVTARQHSRGLMRWFRNPADPRLGTWTPRTIDESQGSHHLVAADFDADGDPDLLTGLELEEIAVYRHDGGVPPSFSGQVVFDSAGHNAVAGDVDGDGAPDIWACDYIGNPPVRVFWNEAILFADGFEGGDTGRWSTTVQ